MRTPWPVTDRSAIDAVLVSQIPANAQGSAAAHCGEGFDFESILVEPKRAVQLAKAVGNVFKRERTILEVDPP